MAVFRLEGQVVLKSSDTAAVCYCAHHVPLIKPGSKIEDIFAWSVQFDFLQDQ